MTATFRKKEQQSETNLKKWVGQIKDVIQRIHTVYIPAWEEDSYSSAKIFHVKATEILFSFMDFNFSKLGRRRVKIKKSDLMFVCCWLWFNVTFSDISAI